MLDHVILHLGVHKTGSTSIQQFLAENRSFLAKMRCLYPKSLPTNHSAFITSLFSERPELYDIHLRAGKTRELITSEYTAIAEDLKKECLDSFCSKMILSGEDGCELSQLGVKKLIDFTRELMADEGKLDIILFVRHPLQFIASAIQENVKSNHLTIEESLRIHSSKIANKYHMLFSRLSEAQPSASISFLMFEKVADHKDGLIGFFCDQVGIEYQSLQTDYHSNKTLCHESIIVIDYARRHKINISNADMDALCLVKGQGFWPFSESEQSALLELCKADCIFLRNRFNIDYLSKPISKQSICRNPSIFIDELHKLNAPAGVSFELASLVELALKDC